MQGKAILITGAIAVRLIDENGGGPRRAAAKAPTEELGRWPFRRPLKKASFGNLAERSQKTQLFQGGPAAFRREKLKSQLLVRP